MYSIYLTHQRQHLLYKLFVIMIDMLQQFVLGFLLYYGFCCWACGLLKGKGNGNLITKAGIN